MTGWLRGWVPLLRIARRDALRARGRSALIVAMIALPVLALAGVDVLARSAQLDPDEELSRALGQTQARLEPALSGGPVLQAPDPGAGTLDGAMEVDDAGPPKRADPSELAPEGYRVLTSRQSAVVTRTRAGVARAGWDEVLVGDPAFEGRFLLRDGAPPAAPGEVAVTPTLLDRLGVRLGDPVELTDPRRTVTVTGVVHQVGSPAAVGFFARPGELIGAGLVAEGPPSVYLAGADPVTWQDVLALNEQGLVVLSRDVLLDPPPSSAVPYYAESGDEPAGRDISLPLGLAVIAVLGGLEVTLLAGAAFAVGARRQARSLGLLAAAGGSSAQVRRVVLSGGLVLGAAGAVIGVALGMALAAATRPLLEGVTGEEFGRYDVRPVELLAIAGVGLVTGLLSAALPARTAARQDPVVALTGRRGQVRTARKVPAIGLVLTLVGVGAAALGSALALARTTGLDPTSGAGTTVVASLIAGGAALAQIGLVITSPAIIGLAGRLSSRLPLPGRLALRDAARHRGRSAPAMAAVLTAVTGSTALLLYITSLDAHDREAYSPSWPKQTGGVSLVESTFHQETQTETLAFLDPRRVQSTIAGKLPPFTAQVIDATVDSCPETACSFAILVTPPENECFLFDLGREPTGAEQRRAAADWRCDGSEGYVTHGSFYGTPVGGAETLRAVAGSAPQSARDVLAAGGVVVMQRGLLRDGKAAFDVVTEEEARAAQDETRDPEPVRVLLPAVYLPATPLDARFAVYSPRAARQLGVQVRPGTLLLAFDRLPSTDEEDAARGALEDAGIEPYLFGVERGYVSEYGLGLLALVLGAGVITLGAAGVATGLAQADARADHATLAAVGAAPRLRRTLAAAQALTIAGLGTVLGIAAGFVPALALIGAVPSLDLVVPWVRLLTVLVAVPVLAGVLAWLLTRSRVPLERRLA